MQLITLNIWGGKLYEPLMQFLEKYAAATDIFCFQEVLFGSQPKHTPLAGARINIYSELEKVLSDFTAITYPAPAHAVYFQDEKLPAGVSAGQAIFIKKSLPVKGNGGFRTYAKAVAGMDKGAYLTGSCQWIELQPDNAETLTILNLHGLWQSDTHKQDTPQRLKQSEILLKFLHSNKGNAVLCGDFNLAPDTQSMRMLEQDMINLIKQYGITSTRSSFYAKPEKFSDYALVSQTTKVKAFTVLKEEVSDHLALHLQFA